MGKPGGRPGLSHAMASAHALGWKKQVIAQYSVELLGWLGEREGEFGVEGEV